MAQALADLTKRVESLAQSHKLTESKLKRGGGDVPELKQAHSSADVVDSNEEAGGRVEGCSTLARGLPR